MNLTLCTIPEELRPYRWKAGEFGTDSEPIWFTCAHKAGCKSNEIAGYVSSAPDGRGLGNVLLMADRGGMYKVQMFCAEHWPIEVERRKSCQEPTVAGGAA